MNIEKAYSDRERLRQMWLKTDDPDERAVIAARGKAINRAIKLYEKSNPTEELVKETMF